METLTQSQENVQRAKTEIRATELAITGMNCGNCAQHVMEAIESVAGAGSASVNLEAAQARVTWPKSGIGNIGAVVEAVEKAGYGARVLEKHEHHETGHEHATHAGWALNLWVGVLCTAPLMLGEWAFGLGMRTWFQWVSFLLASVVQVVAGAQFYRGAWVQLRAGRSNMDTLVALGSTTAFVYSAWALLGGQAGHVYFMEAAAIITLISLGHWLESRMSLRASSALRRLLTLAPALARRRNPDGSESDVPVGDLTTGDLVVLRPGNGIPTDGAVLEGNSAVDESMLTGESVAVEKAAGAALYAGTVNLNGRLLVRVTETGEGTALAHIIEAVRRAQASRASIQRLGDKVSNVFVPIVVAVALLAGLVWGLAPDAARGAHEWLGRFLWASHPPAGALAGGVMVAAAVLIVACPCAMGLATPAAIMAASNAAADRGILLRDGVALEKAGSVSAVLFDKTGTLTIGKPTVGRIWQSAGGDANIIKALAASLARQSTHPASRAVSELSPESIETFDWAEVRGAGIQAAVKEASGQLGQWRLGSTKWLQDSGVDMAEVAPVMAEWSSNGATVVGLAKETKLAALFEVSDKLKPGARRVVERLEKEGLSAWMVTGDSLAAAQKIAREVGIDERRLFAGVKPEDKAELVKKLQAEGKRVAFVGEGINDAPALEQADLGIAVCRASDVAREAADIILLKSEIEAVPESLALARASLRAIKQNLFWAFFYNALAVPLAALGFISPIVCAAAMGLSDAVVIGNALRLRRMPREKAG